MKKIIASLVLAIIALFSFGCTDKLPEEELPEKEMPYNVLYDAKFVDKSERYMTEEFINELGYAGDFHDDRILIIDNKTEFNRVYKSFPYEIDFAKDILVMYLFVDIQYGFDCKLQDMSETKNALTVDILHEIAEPDSDGCIPPCGSAPTHRCWTIKLTDCDQTNIKFKMNWEY